MLKVVIDTNVLVSALLKPDSVPELILSLILEEEMVLCLSEPIATEYEEVLKREKFKKLDRQKRERGERERGVTPTLLTMAGQTDWLQRR